MATRPKKARAASDAPAAPARPVAIVWFRQDLRLSDNGALVAAIESGSDVIPLYVLDETAPGRWKAGGASRWWLGNSLAALAADLDRLGSRLILRRGATGDVLAELAAETGARLVVATRCYEPWAARLELELRDRLDKSGVTFKRYAGGLLFEPESLKTQAGEPFRVYTPFWRAISRGEAPRQPLPRPQALPSPAKWPRSEKAADWKLLPKKPDWAEGLRQMWKPGEAGAQQRLTEFLDTGLEDYARLRDRPDLPGTSRLSAHLHFGEISPVTCWHTADAAGVAANGRADAGFETFLRELVWREFSHHLLTYWPSLPETPFRAEFERFPWREDQEVMRAWQHGMTGYPIVDAGMRELWATGWMHNRVRMIAASFLVKDLLQPWQAGETWFWDTLVDADLANNAASWQWVAGCGADAAPYFRIFSPVKQGETYDPNGDYVRRWVPEIARLPDDYLHAPWTAPDDVLDDAGVAIGDTYPEPIVDHAAARDRALHAFKSLRGR